MGRWMRRLVLAVLAVAALWPQPGRVQELSALARITGPAEIVTGARGALGLSLPLTLPVPYRARLLDDPPRAALDFRRIDWAGFDTAALALPAPAVALRLGEVGDGWSRMVIEFDRPMIYDRLGLSTETAGGGARLELRLMPATQAQFDAQRQALAGPDSDAAPVAAAPPRPGLGARPAVVVLDPGHGGIDPGAERDGLREADLMLTFARELAEVLRRSGEFEVVLTREADVFVSLEARIRIARQAGADLFVSLHADAVPEGGAAGASLYTLADEASEAAAAALAERHDRADLLGGGVDLREADDLVAGVLMSIARTETRPRTDRLARALIGAIRDEGLRMHSRPWQQAAFSVLKAPDIPSVLLELGFMSSPRDLANLRDPVWRARMAAAILAGLGAWVADEAEHAALLRR